MVKKWILKAIVQKVISILPFSFRINYFFQRFITRRVRLSDDFLKTMMQHHRESIHFWNLHGRKVKGSIIIELGTGWHPVIPVLHFLSGAKEVVTIDLRSLLRKKNMKELLICLIKWYDTGDLDKLMHSIEASSVNKIQELIDDWTNLSLDKILGELGIVQVIADARELPFDNNSFDFCSSVNVLEHIEGKNLPAILCEMNRLIQPGGFHYHAIGTYDHFCHVDASISKFNYLRYSERQWKRIDNDIQPQNRLRLSYFRDLFLEMGLEIKESLLWEAEPDEINKIELHSDFQGKDWLDIPYGTFVMMK